MGYRIIIAGIGPGNPDYMVPAARIAIEKAKILVGGSRALGQFAKENQETMAIKADIGAVMDFIKEKIATDDVVVMVSGEKSSSASIFLPLREMLVLPKLITPSPKYINTWHQNLKMKKSLLAPKRRKKAVPCSY